MVLLRTSRWFIVDNAYLPVHVMPHRRGTTVIQVWHAVGALKRFGWDARQPLTDPERRFLHRHYDWVVCSAERVARPVCGGLPDAARAGAAAGHAAASTRSPIPAALAAARARVLDRYPPLAGRTGRAPRADVPRPGRRQARRTRAGRGRPAGRPAGRTTCSSSRPTRTSTRRATPTAGYDLVADPLGRPQRPARRERRAGDRLLVVDLRVGAPAPAARPASSRTSRRTRRDPGLYLDYRDRDDRRPGHRHGRGRGGRRRTPAVDDAAWAAFIADATSAPVDGRASERFVERFLGPRTGAGSGRTRRGATLPRDVRHE